MMKCLDCAIAAAVFCGIGLPLEAQAAERPFVMWDAEDLEGIEQRIEHQAWAEELWRQQPENWAEQALHDLLAYRIYGDREAGRRQKEELMGDVRSDPPLGGAQWVNVVRFDMVHDLLNAEERRLIDRVFRRYIRHAIFENALYDPEIFNDEANYSRYDARYYRRSNWLPNIVWPRRVSANLMAAALGDETLIRKVWRHYGSWQWYFDVYLADSGFYGEEFSKMGATPGAMLIYCRAVENLGLNELGFGYEGRGGATLRGHIRSLIRMGYPRVTLHSHRPQYPKITAGDLRGTGSSAEDDWPTFAFQHSIVPGFLPGGFGGNNFWQAHGAWGGTRRGDHKQWDGYSGFTPKMMTPFWFEQAQARWPQDGYGYFLARMRAPGDERYVPSLYFGLEPIDPGEVEPPAARSWIAPERGLIMLRADESPAYWESEKPAVAMRLASPYAHSVRDNYALAGFYAYHRPLYLNRSVTDGYAKDWTRSVLSHAGVMIDGEEPEFTYDSTTRSGFYTRVKFASASSPRVFEGLNATRALFLTDHYLFDAFHLSDPAGEPHDAHWVVHALGEAALDRSWSKPQRLGAPLGAFGEARSKETGNDWSVNVVQTCALEAGLERQLPEAWYDRKVGVRLSMLGEKRSRVHVSDTPVTDHLSDAPPVSESPGLYEVGGASVVVHRRASSTTFAALHEPFAGGQSTGYTLERLDEGRDYLAVKVVRDGVQDRIFCKWANHREPVNVEAGTEQFTFADHAWVRVTPDAVYAFGDLQALRVPADNPDAKFFLNDRLTPAKVRQGELVYEE